MKLPQLLTRGAIAGAAGGFSAALLVWLVVEPVIRRALVIEEARGGHDHGGGHSHEEALVSRTAQFWVGGVTVIIVGVLFGIIFTVVFAWLRNRLPASTDLGRSLVLAAIGFLVFSLMPAIRIPSNPPAVGDPSTVGQRTLIYLLTILVGILGIGAVLAADGWLRSRVTEPVRVALDVVVGVAWVFGMLLLIPASPDKIPHDVPAALIWDFRLVSLAQLAVMWLVVGLVFGVLVDGRTRRTRAAVLQNA